MIDIQLEISNEAGFYKYRDSIKGVAAQNNKLTLNKYWQHAKARKMLMLIRRVGPLHCQICQIPPQELDPKKVYPRFKIGSLFISGFPDKTYLIFGTDDVLAICKQKELAAQAKKETQKQEQKKIFTRPEFKEEIQPEKKKRGRPRKNI